MASTSPARARRTAWSTASPAIRPAASGRRGGGALPSSPSTVISASSGPRASALATTSGPIPRGSPGVTARRGRWGRPTPLEPDVDVGRAAQQVEVVFDGELLGQAVADAVLHLVERQLALGETLDQLEHDEPWSRAPGAHCEYGLQARHGVAAHHLLVVGWQLRHGQSIGELGLVRIGVGAGESNGAPWASASCTESACRRAIASCAAEIVGWIRV